MTHVEGLRDLAVLQALAASARVVVVLGLLAAFVLALLFVPQLRDARLTLGAICVAAMSSAAAARELFRQLLMWGLSMIVVGALLCQLLAGWFARL